MNAVISPCNQYRYRLDREVAAEGKVIAYFGVNPSYADASIDDNTVIRMRSFTLSHQGKRFIVGNVFSYRSTNVRKLASTNDCFGLEHKFYLNQIIDEADILVPCWGSRNKLPQNLRQHLDSMLRLLLSSGKPVYSFGLTATGDPRHPLMLAGSTKLIPWEYKPTCLTI
ncbi:DUF1643 domain-containing protein [Candidatus Pantoea soli]|uniref:DUF1643 domain-containing protein n=1 Tax=Candidatus Pantoea soli TaxID=3098669 RepID=A0A518XDK5_9GAMM|nr:DUF1643 domain-containing protein [Pantoea soli]QDY42240.1 DUF1643 domain-containing protein [Pantoea soli]